MSDNELHHVKVVQPSESALGTKVLIDGVELHRVISFDIHFDCSSVPTFTFTTLGNSEIDMIGKVERKPG